MKEPAIQRPMTLELHSSRTLHRAPEDRRSQAMELAWTNKHVKYFRVRVAPMWIGNGNSYGDGLGLGSGMRMAMGMETPPFLLPTLGLSKKYSYLSRSQILKQGTPGKKPKKKVFGMDMMKSQVY